MKLEKVQIKETGNKDFYDIMKVENLAFHNNTAVGHILFTRAYIDKMASVPLIHLLAPFAIIPEFQKLGIGGSLINEGLKKLKEIGS